MADRKITVLNPAGYQELFQTGDNLKVDGSVDLQSNTLTGVPLPGTDPEAANKKYVDDAITGVGVDLGNLEGRVDDLESETEDLQDQIDNLPQPGNGEITLTGTSGVTITGDNPFTLNQVTDSDITISGPDLSNYLQKPGSDGEFIIIENSGTITYSDVIDGGTYS